MSGPARSALARLGCAAGRALGQRGVSTSSAARGGHTHDTAVHSNKYVEQWLSRREDIDAEFRWTGATVRHVLLLCIAVPAAIYNGIIWAEHQADDYAGRPRKDFLWGHAEAGERRPAAGSS